MKKIFILCLMAGLLVVNGCQKGSSTARLDKNVVEAKFIHKYGVTVTQEDWIKRGADGEVITTLRDGVTVTKTYTAGILDGITTYSYPLSQTIQQKEVFENGVLRKITENFNSGLPKKEQEFDRDDALVKVTQWFESGSSRSVEEIQDDFLVSGEYFNNNHELESRVQDGKGIRTMRDGFATLISTDTISNGVMTSQMTFHTNGTPKAITPFQDGTISGMRKTFLPGGEPNTIETWRQGTQHGITTVFQNGEKVAERVYNNGIKDGIEKRFRNGVVLAEEITWVKNKRHGPSYTYLEGGIATTWYHRGEQVSKTSYDQLNEVAR